MPSQLSPTVTVATLAVAAVAFGGGYVLAQDEPAAGPPAPTPPAAVELAKERLPGLGNVQPLPDLAAATPAPKPRTKPDGDDSDADVVEPVEPVSPPAPAPVPAPTPDPAPPTPTPDPSPPETFDDSG